MKRIAGMALGATAALLAVVLVRAQTQSAPQQPSPMDSVLLKDYQPDSSLVVPQTLVPKARYPVIDVHSHVYANTPAEIAAWVRTMDETGVELTVILTGATGERFDRLVDLFLKPYPKRFQLFCGIDTTDFDAPDYAQRAARELERCYRKGARGVGEATDKGEGFGGFTGFGAPRPPRPRDKRLHPDDPRLDLFWRKTAELKIPVSLHIADHPSAWRPPDNHQERSPGFQRFNQYGKDIPSFQELMAIRDRFLDRHPEVTLIAVHFSNQGNDFASVAKALDRYPNLYVDLSARGYEIGRQPFTAPKFLAKYKDRVLFGTDQTQSKAMYQAWWRLLETRDEYIPGPSWWRLYGQGLPPDVLETIYNKNARKLLNGTPPPSP